MSSSGRPLAAASTAQGQDNASRDGFFPNQDPNRSPNLNRRPKRTLIESACSACRRRKSKCDGLRPNCSRCQALRTECVYEVQEGESRWSALRRQSKTLEAERNELREILTFLQSQSEPEALEIFHRIRSSDTQETFAPVVQAVRERRGSTQSSNAPISVPGQARLPPFRTIMENSDASVGQSGLASMRRASVTSHASQASQMSDGSVGSYESLQSSHDTATSQPPSA